eukprot:4958475-Pyramimonas_sp.AAC.1
MAEQVKLALGKVDNVGQEVRHFKNREWKERATAAFSGGARQARTLAMARQLQEVLEHSDRPHSNQRADDGIDTRATI